MLRKRPGESLSFRIWGIQFMTEFRTWRFMVNYTRLRAATLSPNSLRQVPPPILFLVHARIVLYIMLILIVGRVPSFRGEARPRQKVKFILKLQWMLQKRMVKYPSQVKYYVQWFGIPVHEKPGAALAAWSYLDEIGMFARWIGVQAIPPRRELHCLLCLTCHVPSRKSEVST
jgi:hypothetical protein